VGDHWPTAERLELVWLVRLESEPPLVFSKRRTMTAKSINCRIKYSVAADLDWRSKTWLKLRSHIVRRDRGSTQARRASAAIGAMRRLRFRPVSDITPPFREFVELAQLSFDLFLERL
jgi:hypothetical protein